MERGVSMKPCGLVGHPQADVCRIRAILAIQGCGRVTFCILRDFNLINAACMPSQLCQTTRLPFDHHLQVDCATWEQAQGNRNPEAKSAKPYPGLRQQKRVR